MTEKKILKFAKERGYDTVEKTSDNWRGYEVYTPDFTDEVHYIGLPHVILVKGEKIRWSNNEEAMDFLDTLPPEEDEDDEDNDEEWQSILTKNL